MRPERSKNGWPTLPTARQGISGLATRPATVLSPQPTKAWCRAFSTSGSTRADTGPSATSIEVAGSTRRTWRSRARRRPRRRRGASLIPPLTTRLGGMGMCSVQRPGRTMSDIAGTPHLWVVGWNAIQLATQTARPFISIASLPRCISWTPVVCLEEARATLLVQQPTRRRVRQMGSISAASVRRLR